MNTVSGVVVNHNGGEQILRCLRALRTQKPRLSELIAVDNGSTDQSVAAIVAEFPDITVIELGRNLGPAAARNAGLARAASALVLFVDDDVYLAPDCLRVLLDRQIKEQAAAVAPRLVLLPESELIQADGGDVHFVGTMILRNGRTLLAGAEAVARSIGAFSSSCVLVDRERVLEAGAFDEAYFIYLEDMELGLRLRAFGHGLMCEPAAVAYHERGGGTPGLSFRDSGAYPKRRAYFTMRNRLRTVLLHYRLSSIALLAPVLLVYEVAALIFATRRGWLGPWFRAWGWQLAHLRETLRRRRWIQDRRRVEDGRLLMGGPIPLAPGVLRSPFEVRAASTFARILDRYWQWVRPVLARERSAHGEGSGSRP
jgi:GT2 family glycosyltransferase